MGNYLPKKLFHKSICMMNNFTNRSEHIQLSVHEPIAIIRISGDVYTLISDVDEAENLLSVMSAINHDQSVKALLMINDAHVFSEKAYDAFMQQVLDPDTSGTGMPVIKDQKRYFLMVQMINRFIKKVMGFKKLFIVGLRGEVVSPFFGNSQAADFKFGARKFSFLMAHHKYGLHPGGALPYFLSRSLHHSKALDVLLRKNPIGSEEALQLGLIDAILEEHDFEQACIDRAKAYCEVPACTLHITKRLLNFERKDMDDYLNHESQLLNL